MVDFEKIMNQNKVPGRARAVDALKARQAGAPATPTVQIPNIIPAQPEPKQEAPAVPYRAWSPPAKQASGVGEPYPTQKGAPASASEAAEAVRDFKASERRQAPQSFRDQTRDQVAAARRAPAPPRAPSLPVAEEAPAEPEIQLAPEQLAAVEAILAAPGHVVLTGAAGAGKSTVLKALRKRRKVTMCSTTAKSALLIDGVTVDKIFAFSRDTWQVWSFDYLGKSMEKAENIIAIDEAGAAGAHMLNLIFDIAKTYSKKIILIGDWAQTAPVKDEWGTTSALFTGATFVKLTECHRQTDVDYLAALNHLRYGVVNDKVREVFRPCIVDKAPADDTFLRGFATHRATDTYNAERLNAVKAAMVTLRSEFTDLKRDAAKPYKEPQREKLMKDSRFAHDEQFRVGARIMIRCNDPEGRFVNGDMGDLVDIITLEGKRLSEMAAPAYAGAWGEVQMASEEVYSVVVRLDRLGGELTLTKFEIETKTIFGRPEYSIRGFPITLGWAITLHSAQGITVDKFYVDMATISHMPGESRHGLAYVAFSRTRTLQGLQIGNWNEDAVFCSDAVRRFI